MAWFLGFGVSLVALLVIAFATLNALGKKLPEAHEIEAKLRLEKSPREVWDVLSNTAGVPSWDKGVDRVERLADKDGHEVWRWFMGRNRMILEITEAVPEKRLVRTIADEAKIFSGVWTFDLATEGKGTIVTLTEHGSVHPAIPRAMLHYLPRIADPAMYLKRHLSRLAGKFGEVAEIEVGQYREIG